MLRDKNSWIRAKTAGNLNPSVSRNRFCDFLADPCSRSFSRFLRKCDNYGVGTAGCPSCCSSGGGASSSQQPVSMPRNNQSPVSSLRELRELRELRVPGSNTLGQLSCLLSFLPLFRNCATKRASVAQSLQPQMRPSHIKTVNLCPPKLNRSISAVSN
jgi:hypothetical protein